MDEFIRFMNASPDQRNTLFYKYTPLLHRVSDGMNVDVGFNPRKDIIMIPRR
jgi:hypothetical protein